MSSQSGQTKSILVYSYNSLSVAVTPEQGRIKIADKDSLTSLSRVYVKVFVKTSDGRVNFFRDGYTDVTGGFNYFDVRGGGVGNIQKFSIFAEDRQKGKPEK